MNVIETGLVLDRLAIAFRVEVPPEALEVWSDHLRNVDPDVAMDAVENVIGTESYFPMVAVFQKEVAHVLRERAKDAEMDRITGRAGPSADCPTCQGVGWFETDPHVKANPQTGEVESIYEQWKPCSQCNPLGYSRWLEHREEIKAVSRYRRGSDEDLGFDPGAMAAQARAILVEKDPSKKPTKETSS